MAKKKIKAVKRKAKRSSGRKPQKPKAKRKRPTARKTGKKAFSSLKRPKAMLEKIGEVTHYFPKVKAAAVKILKNSLKAGEEIYIKGHTTDFREKVNSMQLDHVSIPEGFKGQEIGLLVKSRVRIGDSVYRA